MDLYQRALQTNEKLENEFSKFWPKTKKYLEISAENQKIF